MGLIVTWSIGAMASDQGCRAQESGLIGRLSRQVLTAGGQCMQLTTLAEAIVSAGDLTLASRCGACKQAGNQGCQAGRQAGLPLAWCRSDRMSSTLETLIHRATSRKQKKLPCTVTGASMHGNMLGARKVLAGFW